MPSEKDGRAERPKRVCAECRYPATHTLLGQDLCDMHFEVRIQIEDDDDDNEEEEEDDD